jgi:predicted AlkP superfamily pyrophosphatase or phosphodiesterase
VTRSAVIAIRHAAAALAVALFALCVTACGPRVPALPQGRSTGPASVLLISLDAFRADYLDWGLTPHLSRLAREGVRAAWMQTSYPSLTFPNHYTLVTGLRPDRHGIVHNTMRDATLGAFSLSNREAVGNGAWWGGTPIWVSAEKAGLPTATMFWPGSEAAIQGVRPSRWLPYDQSMPPTARVDTVLGWLGEPAETRPRLVTLYFETLDDAGHGYGPDSPEVKLALGTVDAAIGRLLDGLAARSVLDAVNVIVVADHGLAPVPPGNAVAVEDMVDPKDATVVTTGQSVGFTPVAGREREAAAKLLGKHPRYDCWRKGELPERWHYGRNPRVPEIVCQMHEGWDAASRASLAKRSSSGTRGSHGYDPELTSMRTIFIARGPSLQRGLALPAIDNVDVYPLLMSLLNLPAGEHDGNPKALAPALREVQRP